MAMLNNSRLVGGSAGMGYDDNNKSFTPSTFDSNVRRIPMFEIEGVYPVMVNGKHTISGVILPAFDSSLSPADLARATSHEPYKYMHAIDEKTGLHKFSPWFQEVHAHIWYGKNGSTFISPKTIQQPDPILDLRIHCYMTRKRNGDDSLIKYVAIPEGHSFKDYTVACPDATKCYLMNVVCPPSNDKAKDQSEKNRVLLLKSMAFQNLLSTLNATRPIQLSEANAIDPNWTWYMWGDVTNPAHAIKFKSGSLKGPDGKTFNGISFGRMDYFNGGCRPVYESRAITEQELAGRYDLSDITSTLHIPTYDEIVAQLVHEELIPYDLIVEVCSHKCIKFPERPAVNITSTPDPTPVFERPKQVAPAQPKVVAPAPVAPSVVWQEDPEDNIPLDDAPVWQPKTVATTPAPMPAPAPVPVQDEQTIMKALLDKLRSGQVLTVEESNMITEISRRNMANNG